MFIKIINLDVIESRHIIVPIGGRALGVMMKLSRWRRQLIIPSELALGFYNFIKYIRHSSKTRSYFTLKLSFPTNGNPCSERPSTSTFIIALLSALKNEIVALPSLSVTTLGSQ